MNDFFDDLQRRDDRVRKETINGKEYTAQCTDPYGMWHLKNCKTPELDGSYTSCESLWQAVHAYENANALKKVKASPSEIVSSTKNNKRTAIDTSVFEA